MSKGKSIVLGQFLGSCLEKAPQLVFQNITEKYLGGERKTQSKYLLEKKLMKKEEKDKYKTGEMAQWLNEQVLFLQRTWVQLLESMSGGSLLPLTPSLGN